MPVDFWEVPAKILIVAARCPNENLHVLTVLPDRTKQTVRTWLQSIPSLRRQQVQTICCDMWEAYVAAVQELLPHAAIVIDRFHVAQHYREGADSLRKQELPKDEVKTLKKTLWPFRKRPADLEPNEQERLDALFAHSPALKQAYELREELTTIFNTARAKAVGVRRIKAWRCKVEASELTCFDAFLKLLDTWLDLIANYFRHRQNSGFVEGLNTKLKVLKRRCFGIYNLGHLFQRITLGLNGYRRFSPW